MLEFYEDHEEALKVLNDYAYDDTFPPNPNAHVYLYQYLKRHNATDKKLIKVLKVQLFIKSTVAKNEVYLFMLVYVIELLLVPSLGYGLWYCKQYFSLCIADILKTDIKV